MKCRFLFYSLVFTVAVAFFSACNGDTKEKKLEPVQSTKEQYQCPMKCTDEIFDKPGKCPVCEMELEKIANS